MSNVIIERINSEAIEQKRIKSWPIWTKEVSTFDWYYDSDEECYILEGEVCVETTDGNYVIKAGDFVTFKKGLGCVWKISKAIRKHYHFY
jgi:uncharacterized protein